jgi:ferredoxin-nitrite reductase
VVDTPRRAALWREILPPPPHLVPRLVDDAPVCMCLGVTKGELVTAIRAGHCSIDALAEATAAGTGCGQCRAALGELVAREGVRHPAKPNPIETVKRTKDGLDSLDDIHRRAADGDWEALSEDEKHRFKWHGLFFRKQTPGHFMLRIRMTNGFATAEQFRLIAALSDQYGKGFTDITTRQQIQMRWFRIADVPDIWKRLAEVGLHSKQTGMDNIRNVCGCPLAGLTTDEAFDASPVARALTEKFLDNKAFTNLPRKFNVTITGCLANCCHAETQDLALVPSRRDDFDGFNVLVGGKHGSGGFEPAENLDVFVPVAEAADLAAHVVKIFRDHGIRETRTKARLFFLIRDRGIGWFRAELERRWGRPLRSAGPDLRQPGHNDHLGIQPQKSPSGGPPLFCAGLLIPVGRITTDQMRGVADLAERYGTGRLRITSQQNVVITDIPEPRLAEFNQEPLLKELPVDPSPLMRGLVACTGIDYCHMALIETKDWAIQVARELERRTEGKKVLPLSIHWSGCSAGCGLHQTATIGLQGCRTRIDGKIVEAAHVCVGGKSGPNARVALDLLYDVPCEKLADSLEPLVRFTPRP